MRPSVYILLALVLCLVLCGCTPTETASQTTASVPTTQPVPPDEERILGSWSTAIGCGELCNQQILGLLGEELAVYFDLSHMTIDTVLTFQEDGSFTMTVPTEAAEAFSQHIKDAARTDLHDYLELTLAEDLAGQTLDAYLEQTGLTMDDLLVVAGVNTSQLALDMLEPLRALSCSGTYYLADGQLYIAGTVGSYQLTDESLTLYAPEGADAPASFPTLYPLTLNRVP